MSERLTQYGGPHYRALREPEQPARVWPIVAAVLVILLLVVVAIAHGAQPKAVIDQSVNGVVSLEPGQGTWLTATGSVGDLTLWKLPNITGFGKATSVPIQPGQVGCVELLAITFDNTLDKPYSFTKATIQNGPSPPTPGPTPPVPPNPNPPGPQPNPAPPDVYHLAAIATNAGNSLPAAAKALCPALGDNFSATVAAATGGTLTTISGMNTDVFTRNQKTLGTNKALFGPLSDSLQVGLQAANIGTLANACQAFNEISYGLRNVK